MQSVGVCVSVRPSDRLFLSRLFSLARSVFISGRHGDDDDDDDTVDRHVNDVIGTAATGFRAQSPPNTVRNF